MLPKGFSLGKTTLWDVQPIIALHLSSSAHVGMQQHVAPWTQGLATCLLWLQQGWVGSAPLQKPPSALIPCLVLQQPNNAQMLAHHPWGTWWLRERATEGL